jgi:hypothetical protein
MAQETKVEVKTKTKTKRPADTTDLKHRIMKLLELFYGDTDYDKWKVKYFKQKNGKIAFKYTGYLEDASGLANIAQQLGLSAKDFSVTIWEDEYEYSYQFVF